MAAFKRDTELQRLMLQRLTEAVRNYLEVVERPEGGRHRKTTLIFTGDRYKPLEIVSRYVVPTKRVDNEP